MSDIVWIITCPREDNWGNFVRVRGSYEIAAEEAQGLANDLRAPVSLTAAAVIFLPQEIKDPLLSQPISSLGLSVRAFNALKNDGINTVGDLAECSAAQILRVPNLGMVSFREIVAALATHGLELPAKGSDRWGC